MEIVACMHAVHVLFVYMEIEFADQLHASYSIHANCQFGNLVFMYLYMVCIEFA